MTYVRHSLSIILLLCLVTPAYSQAPLIEDSQLRLSSSPVEVPGDKLVKFTMPTLPRDLTMSEATKRNFRPVIPVRPGVDVRLPLPLEAKVSVNRETIIQFGDPLYRMHPVRVDVYWIGEDSKVRASVRDEFDGQTMVTMSNDGFVAVAGGEYLNDENSSIESPIKIALYDPKGEVIARDEVPAKLDLIHLSPLTSGLGVLYATAPSDDPLRNNRLNLLEKESSREVSTKGLGILQKLTPLSNGKTVLIQGSTGFGLIDLESGDLRWQRAERIRLVGPEAAALDDNMQRLLLATGERTGDSALYEWTVSILDAQTGKSLGQSRLKGRYSGTNNSVFIEISAESAMVLAGDKFQKVSITPR